jgi:WD40 repeat protein
MSTRQYEHETILTGLKESIAALEFSPDGKFLASACEDGSITIFSTFNWKPLQMFIDVSPSTSLTWHPRIKGLLFCGFKSGDIHAIQTNRSRVRPGNRNCYSIFNSYLLAGKRQGLDGRRPTAHPLPIP